MTETIHGKCLCGAVRVSAARAAPVVRACHCDMCREWTGAMFMSVETAGDSLKMEGPVSLFRSSEWAQRGFCSICGSTLFYETIHDGHRNLAAGLFPDAGGGTLAMEYHADRKPGGYAFSGDHTRLSEAETVALFTGGAA